MVGRPGADGGAGRKGRRGGGKKGEDTKDNATVNKGGHALGQGKGGGPSTKSPRAPRERNAPSSSSGAGANNGGAVEGADGGKDTTKERERRTRPALGFGISARQFEAALTGAGVVPVGGAERKSRRDREKERKEAGGTDGDVGGPAKTEGDDNKPASSGRSPRGGGGGRRRGDGAKSPSIGPQRSKTGMYLSKGIINPASPILY